MPGNIDENLNDKVNFFDKKGFFVEFAREKKEKFLRKYLFEVQIFDKVLLKPM